MKNTKLQLFTSIAFLSVLLSSCSVITGIFKAGMGFGIFIAVAIVALILYFVNRSGGSKP
jgi:hypothetical protein